MAAKGLGGSQRQQQLRTRETPSVQQLREWYAGRGRSGGAGPCAYVLRTGTRSGEVCGLPHTTQRCFGRMFDAWRTHFPYVVDLPRCHDQLLQNVPIFDQDFDAILAAMYPLADITEGDFYLRVPPDPGTVAAALGASAYAAPGASAAAALGASASAAPGAGTSPPTGTAPTESFHTFTLDSSASRYFFRDSTTLTPLSRPVAVSLADPSRGPVLAHSSTVLPCPAAPSGLLSGLHLPSFSTNLVSGADLQDAWVYAATSRSSPAPAPCSCRSLAHETLLWHHRLGHPSLPRLRGMASRALPLVYPEAPLQTLHMDVWGPARVRGQSHERYFLLVVDDYSRYTTVFPLRSKGEVPKVLIDWIRGARRQLSESFSSDLPVLRLHSDRGGEFSSDLLRAFCRSEGIHQTFTLLASPQQNGIAERRIGMVMDVARTSMIHAASPHFLWPFAVQYALLSAILQRTSCPPVPFPVSSLASFLTHPGGSSTTPPRVVFCPLRTSRSTSRCRATVSFPTALPLPPPPPLFLAPGPPLVDPLPPQGPAPSGVSQIDPADPVEVAVDSGVARGADPVGAGTRGAETGGAGSGGAENGRVEPEGTVSRGAEPARAASGGALGVQSRQEPLSPQRLHEWYSRRCRVPAGAGAAGAAGGAVGATGGAGAAGGSAGAGAAGGAAGATGGGGAGAAVGAAGAGAAGGAAGTGDPGAEGTGSVSAVSGGAARPRPYFVPLLQQVLGSLPSPGPPPPPFLGPPPVQSQSQLQPASLLPGPSTYSGPTRGLTERREPESRPVSPESRPASPVRTVRAGRVSRPRLPLVPGTHSMTLRPSTAPQSVPLPSSPASSLPDGPDPESDSLRAATPTVMRILATAVTDPLFESSAASALVAELVDFAAACCLDYAASLVAKTVSTSVCPLSVGEAIEGPHSSQWQAAMDAEMASWKSTGTYVDEYPPPGANIVLQRFSFTYSSPQSTPLPTGHSLSAPPSDKSVEPSGPYPELVGCLMYLMTCTRPDLAYPLSLLARYVAPSRHRKVHWDAAKRVLRYLCSTSGMGLMLGGRARVVLTGHADASWVDDLATQRSSQGYTFSLGSGSVSWRSTRSSSVLNSICEAEIYAGAMAAQELRWLTYLLTDLGEAPRSPLALPAAALVAMVGPVANTGVAYTLEARLADARKRHEDGEYRSIPWAIAELGIRAQWATEHPSRPASPRPVRNEGGVDDKVDGSARLSGNDGTKQRGVIKVDGGIDRSQARVQRLTAVASSLRADVDGRRRSPVRSGGGFSATTHVTAGGIATLYGYFKFSPDRITITPLQRRRDLITWRESIEPQLEVAGLKGFANGTVPIAPVEDLELRGEFRAAHLLTFMVISSKGEVTEVLIDWIRAARLRLRESFGSDFPVLHLHSDRGGEFSSARLGAFCRAQGIRQTFTLLASPQRNGIAERRIGMVMDVARTSMIHAAAPHFLWPFAVQYAAHQLNLQPRVFLPETSPTLLWTGKVGDASAFRVWGSRAFVRDLSGAAAAGSGGTCPGGAGAAGPGGPAEAAGVGPPGGSAGASGGTGAAGSPGTGVGAGGSADAGTSEGAGVGAARAGGAAGAGAPAGSLGAVPAGSGGATRPRPYFVPLLEQLQPVSPLPAPSPYTGPTGGLAERRAPASRPASPARTACTSRRTSRPRPPPVPGTHQMALRPSTAPLRVPLQSPPASSLPVLADPESDSLRAASRTVARFLATVVTDPSLASTAASALVAELVDFAACCRLDYAASLVAESASVCPPSVGGECALSTDVLEDRQEEFQCFAAT
ncbi:unnamed protein product [Closterium sp. NIES-54]